MKTMKKIEIYDPAMCCSTGVCGPSVDKELMRVATTIHQLKEMGISVTRYGLASEPQAFVSNQLINDLLQKEGADVLPITLVDGVVSKTNVYPTDEEFSDWLGVQLHRGFRLKSSCGCGPEGCC